MRVLGIETSCDETAAAVVTRNPDGHPHILSNIIRDQIDSHAEFGGVVPEIAARAHLSVLPAVVRRALQDAGTLPREVDAVAATAGPGLAGGLLVGLMTAKAFAAAMEIPFLAINHLEGHALTARLTDRLEFPYLLLLVSGGHTQIQIVTGLGSYERVSTTIDDAIGEAFDKTAKLLGLGYPGGPAVEEQAVHGDPDRFRFPRPLSGTGRLDFSLSGLKTAVRQQAQALAPLTAADIADICASFQAAVCEMTADRAEKAMRHFRTRFPDCPCPGFVAAGGVAANAGIRRQLETCCRIAGFSFVAPPLPLCGDNAAMIAWAGLEHLESGHRSSLSEPPHPRWPLDQHSQSRVGHGKRGAKV